LKPTALGIL